MKVIIHATTANLDLNMRRSVSFDADGGSKGNLLNNVGMY